MQHFRLHRLIGKEFVQIIVILLFWLTWPYEQLHNYVSPGAPRIVSGTERLEHHEQWAEAVSTLALGTFAITASFAYSFIKFDRKQNTRLWPFVTTGTTRSPPSFL
jgi:hypothetical protein